MPLRLTLKSTDGRAFGTEGRVIFTTHQESSKDDQFAFYSFYRAEKPRSFAYDRANKSELSELLL